jgi:hypothetical protein
MPAKSEAQQRFMGMALAAKRGKGHFSKKVMEAAESMSEKQLRDFAKTKHEGLPEKKAYLEGFMKRAAEYGYSESEISEAVKLAGMLSKIKEYMKKHEDEPSESILKGFVKKQKEGLPALLKMRRLDRMRELGRQMDEK